MPPRSAEYAQIAQTTSSDSLISPTARGSSITRLQPAPAGIESSGPKPTQEYVQSDPVLSSASRAIDVSPPPFDATRFWNLPPLPGGVLSSQEKPGKIAAEMDTISRGVLTHDLDALTSYRDAAALIAAGVSPIDESAATDRPFHTNCSLWESFCAVLWAFISSGRTEKALRFVLTVPLAVYFGSGGFGDERTVRQLSLILFILTFLLLGPLFSHNVWLWFGALPAVLTGLAITTLVLIIETRGQPYYETRWPSIWSLLLLCVAFLWTAAMRVSPFRNLLNPIHYSLAYTLLYATGATSSLMRVGTTMRITARDDVDIRPVIENSQELLPAVVRRVWLAASAQLQEAINTGAEAIVRLPQSIKHGEDWMRYAVGKPVIILRPSNDVIQLHMPGGFYLYRMYWTASSLNWSVAAVELIAMLCLLYLISTLIPPPRTYLDRVKAGSVLLAERLVFEAAELGKKLRLVDQTPVVWNAWTSDGDSEPDAGLRFIKERFRESRTPLAGSTTTPRKIQERFREARIRGRYGLTKEALRIIQFESVWAMQEPMFFSPLGVNTTVTQPFLLKAMEQAATSMYITSEYWKLMESTFPCGSAQTDFLQELKLEGVSVAELLAMWVQDCARLLDAISAAVGTGSHLRDNSGGRRRVEAAKEHLLAAASAVRECDLVIKAVERLLADEVKQPTIAGVTGCRRLATAVWLAFYQKAYVKDQLRLCEECESYLKLLETRGWKGFFRSLRGILLPLRIFFTGAAYVFLRGCRSMKDRHKLTKNADATAFQAARETAHKQPNLVRPPTTGRIRRYRVIELAVNGSRTRLRQSSIISGQAGPPSPSGLGEVQRLPTSDHAPGTDIRSVIYEGDDHHLFQNHNLWHVVRFAIGATIVLALSVFWNNRRTRNYLSSSSPYITTSWHGSVSPWGGFAFLVTLSLTLQGTLNRAILVALGTVLGSALASICVAVSTTSAMWYISWVTFTGASVLWFSANSRMPWAHYHPCLELIGVTAILQQVAIISDAYYGFDGRWESCINWLVGNLLATLLAVLLSLIIVPTRANRAIRRQLSDALFSGSEAFAACAEMALCDGHDNMESGPPALLFRQEWENYHDFQRVNGRFHVREVDLLLHDAFLASRLPTPLLHPEANLKIIGNGAERLLDYAAACKQHLNEIKRINQRDAKPADLAEIDLERKFKEVLVEVTERIINTHAFVQTAINHCGRWRWPWQRDPWGSFTRQQFSTTLQAQCLESTTLIMAIGVELANAAEENDRRCREHKALQKQVFTDAATAAKGQKHHVDEHDPRPESPLFITEPVPVLPPHRDRRTLVWAFALMHLAELNYIGAHAAIMFPEVPEFGTLRTDSSDNGEGRQQSGTPLSTS